MGALNEVILRVGAYYNYSMFSNLAFAEYFAPMRQILLALKTFSVCDGPAVCESIRKLRRDVAVDMRPDYA
jgi:hypothetical protein